MKLFITYLLVILYIVVNATPPAKQDGELSNATPLVFLENKGQITDQNHQPRNDVQFKLSAAKGLNIFIGAGTIHYQFNKREKLEGGPNTVHHINRVDVELLGANLNAEVITTNQEEYHETYSTGNSELRAYAYTQITYKDIYPNIDWKLFINNGQLEHEFVVHDGGNASDIRIKYAGQKEVRINEKLGVTIETTLGNIIENAPTCLLPNGTIVKSRFILSENTLTYEIDKYTGDLLIDPALVWGTYFGTDDGRDVAHGVATDNSNNVYVAGATDSYYNIATTGANDTVYDINELGNKAYLAKFDSAAHILWATYYGGYGTDAVDVAIDLAGDAFITGTTSSATNIATLGAYQPDMYSSVGSFLAKFNSAGNLLWSTYYGDMNEQQATHIKVDRQGDVFITGTTVFDIFLTKFSNAGAFQWSKIFGDPNSNYEYFPNIAITGNGNIFMTGCTGGAGGIATPGAYQTVRGGTMDAFVARFDNAGNLKWATYYGGEDLEFSRMGIATDLSGNVIIAGTTYSHSHIATPGAYQTTLNLLYYDDNYLAKFDSTGKILWATYYGGENAEGPASVATDSAGNIFMGGSSASATLIATPGAYRQHNADQDAYLVKFNAMGTLQWGTYFGAILDDDVSSIAIDRSRKIYLHGNTLYSTGLTTPGSYQPVGGGNFGGTYLAKFDDICAVPSTAGVITGNAKVCIGSSITLSNALTNGIWTSEDPLIVSVDSTGKVYGLKEGTAKIYYQVRNNCGTRDTFLTVQVPLPHPLISHDKPLTICPNDSNADIILSSATAGFTAWQWALNGTDIPNAILDTFNAQQLGKYTLSVMDANGCTGVSPIITIATDTVVTATIHVSGRAKLCEGDSVLLTASSGLRYLWNTGDTTQSITVNATDIYSVKILSTCDVPPASVYIEVNPLPVPIISDSNDVLATGLYNTYQWYLGTSAISQATYATYTASHSGEYYVSVIDSNGCAGKSATKDITISGIQNIGLPSPLIYPNPTTGKVFINGKPLSVMVYDYIGQLLKTYGTTNDLSIADLANGIYTIKIATADGKFFITKVIKSE